MTSMTPARIQNAFTYEITVRKSGETKTYIRVGEERTAALSTDYAKQGYRVQVRVKA